MPAGKPAAADSPDFTEDLHWACLWQLWLLTLLGGFWALLRPAVHNQICGTIVPLGALHRATCPCIEAGNSKLSAHALPLP